MNYDNKKYNFDLRALEREADLSYTAYSLEKNNESRTRLCMAIKDLAFAILSVGKTWKNYKIDRNEVAYDYCVYLYQRIERGFIPEGREDGKYGKRFPWQMYIALNLIGIVIASVRVDKREELKGSMDDLLADSEDKENVTPDTQFDIKVYKNSLFSALKLFYNNSEINRLFPLCRDVLSNYPHHKTNNPEVAKFCSILLSLSKKLIKDNKLQTLVTTDYKTFSTSFKDAMSNSVFLATLEGMPENCKPLLLSCDMDSFYRLVVSYGGTTVSIPTIAELNTVMLTSAAISKAISDGQNPYTVADDLKRKNVTKGVTTKDMHQMITKVMDASKMSKEEDPSQPIVKILLKSMESLLNMLDSMESKINDSSFEDCYKSYTDVSMSLNKFLESLSSVANLEAKRLESEISKKS